MPSSRFGFSPEEWTEMQRATHRVLCDVAASRGTITYGELASGVSGGRISARSSALMELLSDACRDEDEARGTMLASVVVRADTGRPGDGYFAHLERTGVDVSDPEALWRGEAERVWDSWAAPEEPARQEVAAK